MRDIATGRFLKGSQIGKSTQFQKGSKPLGGFSTRFKTKYDCTSDRPEIYDKNSYMRWYRSTHPHVAEYQKKYMANYRLEKPEVIRRNHQKRKAMQKNGGFLSVAIIQRVYEANIKRYGTLTCYLCNTAIAFGNDHLEHKIPLIRGGSNEFENLDVSCSGCNLKKGSRTAQEFLEARL